nr:hypothetical protein [Escherichia coli]
MEYDAAGRVISLTNENGSHSVFSYDALDRLVQQGGFDGRTQRYHYDLTGKLMTTATWCASAARDRRGNTATAPRAGWRVCAPSHQTWTSASRMPRTRRATGCRTRSCTRTVHSQCGRITASRRMRTMSTATMNTAG